MADIAQLGIEIDTRKLKSGEKDLASFANSAKTATSAVMALVGAASVSQLIKIADGYAQMEAKVSRYTKSQIEANNVLQQLNGYANKSGSAVSDAVNVFNSLTASLESVGASKNQILTVTEEINKLGVIGGSSVYDMRNSMRQFGQSMAGGIVRAEEFNSIIENTPEIARAIAAGMGVSMGQLRQDMLAGKLTSDAVFKALLSQVGTTNDAFAKMPRSVAQAMGQISNNFQVVVGELNKTTGATATLAAGLDSFSSSMLSASNYTDEIITGVELLALAYSSKLAGALANTIATRLQAAAADARGVASANALTLANVELANSELAKVQASKAELLLNQQLLVSQLQLAQSETTRNAIRRQLAANSAALVATARLEQAALAGVAAANEAVTVTSYAATVATRALNGAMSLLGGPAGAIILVASAFMYFTSKTDDAATAAEEFTKSVSITRDALSNLTTIQRQALEVTLQQNLVKQNEAYIEQAKNVSSLQKELNNYSYWTDSQKQASTSYLELQDRITLATAEMERREQEASKTKSALYGVQQTLNGNVKENYVAMQSMNSITGIASGIQNVFTGTLNTGNQALATRNEYVTRLNNLTTKAGQAALLSLDQQIKLENTQGVARARLQAQYEAEQKGLTGIELQKYIAKSEELYNIQQKNAQASKSVSSANAGTASSYKTAAKSAEEYAQFSQELSRLNATEAQQIQNWQADKLADLDSYHAQGLVKAGEYEFGKQAIMAESNRRTKKLNDDQWSEYLNGSSAALLKLKQQAQTQLTGPKQQVVVSGIDQKLKEQTFSGLPTIDGGAQSNEQNQIAQLQTQTTAMNDAYNQRIADYQRFRSLEVENAAYYDSQIQALEDKKKANNAAAQSAMLNLQLSAGESMAASAADSFKSVLGEQSAAYQTMFAVQKAFSIAQSMIAIQTGIAQAAALPFPANLGAMATVAAATANIVSSIMSIASPSFDGGGYTGNGSRSGGLDGKGGFWAMMHPQETVIDHTKSNSSVSSGSVSGGNVTVNVSLQETSDTSKQGTTQQSTNDDGSVQINVFVADIRSEGSMAQVLERTYGLTRMGA